MSKPAWEKYSNSRPTTIVTGEQQEGDGLARSIRTSRVDLIVVCLGIVLVEDVRGDVGSMVRVDHCVGRGTK
jgi:hypothetical protein